MRVLLHNYRLGCNHDCNLVECNFDGLALSSATLECYLAAFAVSLRVSYLACMRVGGANLLQLQPIGEVYQATKKQRL